MENVKGEYFWGILKFIKGGSVGFGFEMSERGVDYVEFFIIIVGFCVVVIGVWDILWVFFCIYFLLLVYYWVG